MCVSRYGAAGTTAGGSALGVIALVLVLFIILDAAGATDVFPRI